MKAFDHMNAASVEDATHALSSLQGRGVLIAGGTDLLGCLKDGILPDYPETLINLKTIAGLDEVREEGDILCIGAMGRLSTVAGSQPIHRHCRILAEASESVASPQIRNMATLGGNLCQDVRCWYYRYPKSLGGPIPCYRKLGKGSCPAIAGDNRYHAVMDAERCFAVCPSDTAVALTALGAAVRIAGPEETRSMPVEDLYTERGLSLRPGEIITEIRVPFPERDAVQVFTKYTLRAPVDFAVVSVAVVFTVEHGCFTAARIVLGGVASRPLRVTRAEEAILGHPVSEETASEAGAAAVSGTKSLSGNGYKLDLVRSLVKRALLEKGLGEA